MIYIFRKWPATCFVTYRTAVIDLIGECMDYCPLALLPGAWTIVFQHLVNNCKYVDKLLCFLMAGRWLLSLLACRRHGHGERYSQGRSKCHFHWPLSGDLSPFTHPAAAAATDAASTACCSLWLPYALLGHISHHSCFRCLPCATYALYSSFAVHFKYLSCCRWLCFIYTECNSGAIYFRCAHFARWH